jgi:ubiquinone/menaquinone biosynthesis C-methylase UbiE
MEKVGVYEKLAEIYDSLMDHVDYENWALYLKKLFKYADGEVNHILDLSCGTGNLLLYMKEHAYRCYGCDISRHMLKTADEKLRNYKISFFANDACNIAIKDQIFDAVLFLYDSINYILKKDTLSHLFKEVLRILKPGGLFIFDTVTEYHCKTYYHNNYESEYWHENGYERKSVYDDKSKLQMTNFKIKLGEKYYLENHQQRIYSAEELVSILCENNFSLVGIYQDFTFNKMRSDAERVHYICRKSQKFY